MLAKGIIKEHTISFLKGEKMVRECQRTFLNVMYEKKKSMQILNATSELHGIIRDTGFWIEMVRPGATNFLGNAIYYNGHLWNTNVNLYHTYMALLRVIPFESSIVWCITPGNRSGNQGAFSDVVANTTMVSYLVGDDIYRNWRFPHYDLSDIQLYLKLVYGIRSCYDSSYWIAELIQYYRDLKENS